jgi:hypothetical protein
MTRLSELDLVDDELLGHILIASTVQAIHFVSSLPPEKVDRLKCELALVASGATESIVSVLPGDNAFWIEPDGEGFRVGVNSLELAHIKRSTLVQTLGRIRSEAAGA